MNHIYKHADYAISSHITSEIARTTFLFVFESRRYIYFTDLVF